ncbi:MAG: hypothetical protein AAF288_05270 [Planctomycetota bacterium]
MPLPRAVLRNAVESWSRRAAVLALLVSAVLAGGCVNEAVLARKADKARAAGNLQAEIDAMEQSARLFPGSYENQLRLGRLYLEAGKPLRAETPLTLAHEIGYDWEDRRLASADALAEAYYRQGAEEDLARFVRSESQQFGTVPDYLRDGEYMARIGDHDAAAGAFEKASYFANPLDPEPHLARGRFFESISDRESATIAYRHAYTVAPDSVEAREALRGLGLVPGPTLLLEPPRPVVEVQAEPAPES